MQKKAKRIPTQLKKQLGKSYWTLFVFFFLIILGSIDWIGNLYTTPNTTALNAIAVNQSSPLQLVLSQDPWNFFHPAWNLESKDDSFSKETPTVVKLPIPQANLTRFIEDPEKKVDPQFAVPASLRKRVLFWMEIYSKYSSKFRVVHDRDNPSLIYGVIDLRPLYRVFTSTKSADSKSYELEKQILRTLKTKLTIAVNEPHHSDQLDINERDQIRSFLSKIGSLGSSEVQLLLSRIRSQTGQRDMFLQALYRSSNLLPHIETVFRRNNLPVALARIPFVESSFNIKALSNAGAIGIWQFMPETAKQMIHPEDDKHWSDPLKQTTSAARLFQIYRSMLPDWGTTVTSYNSGVGRVKNLCQKYRIKKVDGLLNIQGPDGLGFAGQNFYSEVLAANLVEAYKDEIFDQELLSTNPVLVLKGTEPFPKELCDL